MPSPPRLYEVGRNAIYYIGGRTSGDSSIDRVVGPRSLTKEFYTTYGDICNARTNTLQFTIGTNCGTNQGTSALSGAVSYSCFFCVIVAVGLGVGAQDMIINESIRLMFSSFEYEDLGNSAANVLAAAAGVSASQVGSATGLAV